MSSAGAGRREVAHRLFAAEYDDASLEYAESDEERAPNYVVTPSGARVNRLFVVGVLTAVEQVNEDTVRARIADPTGVFVVYAGQYQPDELAALQSLESPAFVAVTGKANTFSPDGSDRVLTSVRPERVTEVDAETRDRWVVATAEHTLARIQTIAGALEREERGEELRAELLREGVEPGFAEGVAKALDHYGTTADYLGALRDLANQALEVVAGERSEVEPLELAPGDGDGTVAAGDLADLLPDERRSAAEAAEEVDPEVLLETDASSAGESAAEAADDAEQATASTTDVEAEEEPEPETDESGAEEPVTDERGAEATADDAEEAADAEPERADETEPETSESAVEETTADADTAAETGESDESAEADAADELYEVDEEEREEIEEEYGVEFQSGTEVDPAGEAGIETEDEPPVEDEPVDEPASAADDAAAETAAEGDAEEIEESAETDASDDAEEVDADADEAAESDETAEPDEDVDLEGVVLEEMDALDDGDGADREALQEAVAEATGADADEIDDAIDDLLMSGQCYEPSEGRLKPI